MSQTITHTGKPFVFNASNLKKAKVIIARYPKGRQASAVIPLLDLAQRQNKNFVSQEVIEYVAEMLTMPAMRVLEVASFYTMFNLQPVGKNLVQVCHTTPCWLRGADQVVAACESHLGVKASKETTTDGQFTLMRVECLGACANAPVVQINDDYYEDVSPDLAVKLLKDLAKGKKSEAQSLQKRNSAAPAKHALNVVFPVGVKK